eukprot:gb/GFBE01057896.1/.p1 GENE.gb/GFBE01057896.1/~~gb/GFBE01057896.1/.p1  ORF type:complete len:540 (+),score=109.79 gb/GFBE01057896.1/:1-1620(+)
MRAMVMSRLACLALAAAALDDVDVQFPDPADFMVSSSVRATASFKLSATLGDHMVLQRAPASAVVWGFAPPGTEVKTTFNGATVTSTAGADSVWRAGLAPTAAGGPYKITFSASTGETASLSDVMFGDVYVCGGQSNMQFSVGGNENAAAYAKEADRYPGIRLFTVGQKTSSKTPLADLQTIEQNWTRASSTSVGGPGGFNYFSAVCWFFGKGIYDGLGGKVPVGLVSSNWGGTRVEQWMSPETSKSCGHPSTGELYNAMIVPYTVGPMAVTGFTWYQGESDLGGNPALPDQNNNYTCTQTAMIELWREKFQAPESFFAVVLLSTWFPGASGNLLLPQLRDQQVASSASLSNFAYASNEDYGAGGNIHPPYKQHPGARLANAALAIVYHRAINWRSPSYASAKVSGSGKLTVRLNDVTAAGLALKDPFNAKTAGDCAELNAKTPRTCAWAELQFNDSAKSWVNASVGLGDDKMTMVLSAPPPAGATAIIASSYGWGAIPMLTVYRADMDGEDGQLPVLSWKRALTAEDGAAGTEALLVV